MCQSGANFDSRIRSSCLIQPADVSGTQWPNPPDGLRRSPNAAMTRWPIQRNQDGRRTCSGMGGEGSSSLKNSMARPESCHWRNVWARSACGCSSRRNVKTERLGLGPGWTSSTRRNPCARRKFPDGKSVVKETERLSNLPSESVTRPRCRFQSSRNAGGALEASVSCRSSTAPNRRAVITGCRSTAANSSPGWAVDAVPTEAVGRICGAGMAL